MSEWLLVFVVVAAGALIAIGAAVWVALRPPKKNGKK
jgi:hypothetical protein